MDCALPVVQSILSQGVEKTLGFIHVFHTVVQLTHHAQCVQLHQGLAFQIIEILDVKREVFQIVRVVPEESMGY